MILKNQALTIMGLIACLVLLPGIVNASAEPPKITLHILIYSDGTQLDVQTTRTSTVRELKEEITRLKGIPAHLQVLALPLEYQGEFQTMHNNEPLSNFTRQLEQNSYRVFLRRLRPEFAHLFPY